MTNNRPENIFMHQLRAAGYEIDTVLDLLKRGDVSARGRLNTDYTDDERLPEKNNWIDKKHWVDFKYSKQRKMLENSDTQMCYSNIYLNRDKLDKALNKIPKAPKGAAKIYNEARFFEELCMFVITNDICSYKSNAEFYSVLLNELPYLKGLKDKPSTEWLKKKTVNIIKTAKESLK